MANIQPLQNFVLVKFVPKDGSMFHMPDGSRNPQSHCVVQAIGPDVPQTPPLKVGMKLLLRGDSKIFPLPNSRDTACIPYPVIMAIDARKDGEEEEELEEAKVNHLLASIN